MSTHPDDPVVLTQRIARALKTRGTRKSANSNRLLGGVTNAFLRAHLEQMFKPGMTWENYGKWHVDHIRPCASFDLTNPREQRKCFHYSNLQPLWAIENILKRDKTMVQGDLFPSHVGLTAS